MTEDEGALECFRDWKKQHPDAPKSAFSYEERGSGEMCTASTNTAGLIRESYRVRPEPREPEGRTFTRPNGQIITFAAAGRRAPQPDGDPLRGFVLDDDSAIEAPDYLVKGLLSREGVAFVGGQSGAGKSFIALLLATCLASGQPFFGRKIKERVGVAVLAAEGAGTYKHRLRVARQHAVGDEALPICYLGSVPDLKDQQEIDALAPRLRAVAERFQKTHGVRFGAVIIDTVAAAFDLDDENNNSEAARTIRAIKGLGEKVGDVLMIPVHHYGKAATTGLRGASGWKAGCDTILSVLADRNEVTGKVSNRELALAKSRDFEEGAIAPFELRFVRLGTDDDGDDFGSCYVEPLLDRAPIIAGERRRPRKTRRA
jgi:RecA-family ATPase